MYKSCVLAMHSSHDIPAPNMVSRKSSLVPINGKQFVRLGGTISGLKGKVRSTLDAGTKRGSLAYQRSGLSDILHRGIRRAAERVSLDFQCRASGERALDMTVDRWRDGRVHQESLRSQTLSGLCTVRV